MMGTEVEKLSTLVGDNNAAIINTRHPSISLKKKLNSVSFHKSRVLVSSGFVRTGHIGGNRTPTM